MRTVTPGDTLLLHYRLSAGEGTVLESTFEGEPLLLTLGQGELEPNLEVCLLGLPENEIHVFQLEPPQAFGACDPARIQRLPLAAFPADMAVQARALVEFALPNGKTLLGTVLERTDQEVVVDFNHPLCGCPVEFEVKVLEIRRPETRAPERR